MGRDCRRSRTREPCALSGRTDRNDRGVVLRCGNPSCSRISPYGRAGETSEVVLTEKLVTSGHAALGALDGDNVLEGILSTCVQPSGVLE